MASEECFHRRLKPISTQMSLSSSSGESEPEPEERQLIERAPPFWRNPRGKKKLSKQLSMCETPRDVAWERRRRQILLQERNRNGIHNDAGDDLTDEDLNELRGSIELGFGFNEEQGMRLCRTLPALDLYFAVNRQFSPSSPVLMSPVTPRGNSSPASTTLLGGSSGGCGGGSSSSSSSSSLLTSSVGSSPSNSLGQRSSSFGSPRSDTTDSWKILSPGDDPEQVKTKLRHWAQAVACSVMQSY
ncbi:OLC1v1033386C1 [Oldenlandia corymbosa var. corymbosa]|uniref:OLC1v1033386C1 n=1 Tax=Oldenlandia corymbosa var. corymbosa TaxID=529605 RepID=A0AAV1CNY4_OLDCO|nr:OLC1v1033386C1 [Oldenlandia corymbosa var. corymbosa]